MNEATFTLITAELSSELIGKKFGKIFSLSRNRLVIDFRLADSKYLFISIDPSQPRMHLVRRRFSDLDNSSKAPTPFLQFLRNRLSGGILRSLRKVPGDRIFEFEFLVRDEVGQIVTYFLIAQFSGRSSNLFLLDDRQLVLASARETEGSGQQTGDQYAPPERKNISPQNTKGPDIEVGSGRTLSEVLDEFYIEKENREKLKSVAEAARSSVKREIKKVERLLKNLENDLRQHGDAERWKKYGDLLLANSATARREGDKFVVTDFYAEETPEITIDADENLSLTEAAERYFKQYSKARNAAAAIAERQTSVENELHLLRERAERIDEAIADGNVSAIAKFLPRTKAKNTSPSQRAENSGGAVRRFRSSDGFEILVGRGSKDNDILTFKMAKSLDVWLHAADYPGSHVVIKNPNRVEIPQKTLFEAAEIAAFFSKARSEAKAAVNYTEKKFVNKPKGAAPGLVSLASFKTLLVEPKNPQGEAN